MQTLTRRHALRRLASLSSLSSVQGAPSNAAPAVVPRDGLVNVLEYEAQARAVLPARTFALLAGGDRAPFERITLRPRMLVPATDLDLGLHLLGHDHFAPILVGPVSNAARFHPDGERALVAGASAAHAAIVLSSRSSVSVAEAAAAATTPIWAQVFAGEPRAGAVAAAAVKAGCPAVCVTVGLAPTADGGWAATPPDWTAVAAIARRAGAPVVVKGVTTPADAARALASGARGLIVSTHGSLAGARAAAPIAVLPAIVDAVGGRVPVLADGSFRRGTDILKALAFGATAVLVARPVMWGLSAYGADGVQGVLEMLQTELARYMAMCGRPTLGSLDRTMVRVHGGR